jgi:hypothetical protein
VGKKNSYRILVGKPECDIPVEIQRLKWTDNIKTDFMSPRME